MGTARARWIAAGLALLLACTLAWLWQGPGRGDGPSGLEPAPASEHGERELSGPPEARDHRGEAAMSAPAESPAPERAVEAPLSEGVPVRVVLGLTDEPVPFALVDVSEDLPRGDAEEAVGGFFQLPENATTLRFRADAEGRALLPRAEGGAYATCAAADAWGFVELEPSGENLLRLLPDPPLRVRVVDGEGRPIAGAVVGLYCFDGYEIDKLLGAETDAAGLAELRRLRWPLLWYEDGYAMQVRLEGAFDPPVLAAFDPSALPIDVVLVQPPHTRLEVEVVTDEGTPWDGPALVTVAPVADAPEDDPFEDSRWIVAAPVEGGRARFERVGVDLPLVLVASAPEHGDGEQVRVRSAPQEGDTVAASAPLGIPQLVLAAGLATENGQPFVSREVEVHAAGNDYSFDLRTDARGQVRLALSASWIRKERIALEFRVPRAGLVAQAEVQGPFHPGERLLGALRLEQAPGIVAGRVADELGRPLAGASIELSLDGWHDAFARASSSADGSFAVHGRAPGEGRLLLRASCPQHASVKDLEVAPGAEGLLLTLPSRGSIEGSLLVPMEWWCNELDVSAVREDTGEVAIGDVDRPGVFHIGQLEPASYTVRIMLEYDPDGALAIPGIEVRAGEPTRDPRLKRFDLGALQRFEVAVTDASGAAIPQGSIYVRESGRLGWSHAVPLLRGRASCRTLAPALDVCAVADDFSAALSENVRTGKTIVLDPSSLFIRLQCRQALPRGLDLWELRPSLESDDPRQPHCRPKFNEDGSLVANLPFPGRYAVVFTWGVGDNDRSWRVPIEVPDQDGMHEVLIDVPQELLSLVEILEREY